MSVIVIYKDNISIKIASVPKYPGDREDNLWVCYDADKVPKTEVEWKEKNFVHKTHFGYYSWPSEMKVQSSSYSRHFLRF